MKRLLFIYLLFTSVIYSKSTLQKIGDILAISLPLYAYSKSISLNDKIGQKEFLYTYSATMLTTYFLKYTTKEKRPDSTSLDSFPSGHSASAFSSAFFIHRRYGFKSAIIPYIGAVITGYSRVKSKRHYIQDVIGGAIVSGVCAYYFTKPYKGVNIMPEFNGNSVGIKATYRY